MAGGDVATPFVKRDRCYGLYAPAMETPVTDPVQPEGPGDWLLLQDHIGHAMWQQDETDAGGRTISRFWVVSPEEQLMFDTFDEAEALFEQIGDDDD
jgi:hypothetical protein